MQRLKGFYGMRRNTELTKSDKEKSMKRKLSVKASGKTYVSHDYDTILSVMLIPYMQLARTEAVKRAIKEGCLNPSDEDAVFQVRRSVPQVMKLTLHGHIKVISYGVFHRLK